mmetsp:Transcript_38140/g.85423  ORF Transcript_38140/g.85423 Transcript_38140/m.85423 type:complete len:394 (+) Transcript_38140:310-1491(+)
METQPLGWRARRTRRRSVCLAVLGITWMVFSVGREESASASLALPTVGRTAQRPGRSDAVPASTAATPSSTTCANRRFAHARMDPLRLARTAQMSRWRSAKYVMPATMRSVIPVRLMCAHARMDKLHEARSALHTTRSCVSPALARGMLLQMGLAKTTSAAVMEDSLLLVLLASSMIQRSVRAATLDFALSKTLALPTSVLVTMVQQPLVQGAQPTRRRLAERAMMGSTLRDSCVLKMCAPVREALPRLAQLASRTMGRSALHASPGTTSLRMSAEKTNASATTGRPQQGCSALRMMPPCAKPATRATNSRWLSASQRTNAPARVAPRPLGWRVPPKEQRFAPAAPQDSIRKRSFVSPTSAPARAGRLRRAQSVTPTGPPSVDRATMGFTLRV